MFVLSIGIYIFTLTLILMATAAFDIKYDAIKWPFIFTILATLSSVAFDFMAEMHCATKEHRYIYRHACIKQVVNIKNFETDKTIIYACDNSKMLVVTK